MNTSLPAVFLANRRPRPCAQRWGGLGLFSTESRPTGSRLLKRWMTIANIWLPMINLLGLLIRGKPGDSRNELALAIILVQYSFFIETSSYKHDCAFNRKYYRLRTYFSLWLGLECSAFSFLSCKMRLHDVVFFSPSPDRAAAQFSKIIYNYIRLFNII